MAVRTETLLRMRDRKKPYNYLIRVRGLDGEMATLDASDTNPTITRGNDVEVYRFAGKSFTKEPRA